MKLHRSSRPIDAAIETINYTSMKIKRYSPNNFASVSSNYVDLISYDTHIARIYLTGKFKDKIIIKDDYDLLTKTTVRYLKTFIKDFSKYSHLDLTASNFKKELYKSSNCDVIFTLNEDLAPVEYNASVFKWWDKVNGNTYSSASFVGSNGKELLKRFEYGHNNLHELEHFISDETKDNYFIINECRNEWTTKANCKNYRY